MCPESLNQTSISFGQCMWNEPIFITGGLLTRLGCLVTGREAGDWPLTS